MITARQKTPVPDDGGAPQLRVINGSAGRACDQEKELRLRLDDERRRNEILQSNIRKRGEILRNITIGLEKKARESAKARGLVEAELTEERKKNAKLGKEVDELAGRVKALSDELARSERTKARPEPEDTAAMHELETELARERGVSQGLRAEIARLRAGELAASLELDSAREQLMTEQSLRSEAARTVSDGSIDRLSCEAESGELEIATLRKQLDAARSEVSRLAKTVELSFLLYKGAKGQCEELAG